MRSARLWTALLAATLVAGYAPAQTSTQATKSAAKKTTKAKKESATDIQLRELREQLKSQQDEIDALKSLLTNKDQQVSQAAQAASAAQSQAEAATTAANQAQQAANDTSSKQAALASSVADMKTANAGLQETVVNNQAAIKAEIESPTALHYKGLAITPVAFAAFEGVWRQHTVNSDINTPFNSIPFPSANEYQASELNFSGRQSRIGALFAGNTGHVNLNAYVEADFLGTGTSSNNNQSNSYVLRMRQFWGRALFQGGFGVTGGQTWSLVTEDRRGTMARTEIQPQTIDPQYLVGYTWERQPGIRVQQHWGTDENHGFTAALSLEQAQITNFTANGTNPTQYFFGGLGQNGGLYNAAASSASTTTTTTTCSTPTSTSTCVTSVTAVTSNITAYANNTAPDVIVKFAYDAPKFHGEIGGVGRFLRDYYYPVTWGGTAAAPTFTYTTTYAQNTAAAGGIFGSLRGYLGTHAEIAFQAMGGSGTGRYGSAQLSDVTLKPNETLSPIHDYHGLLSIETHEGKNFDIFAYYGGEYAQRTVYISPVGNQVGYGTYTTSDTGCYNAPAPPSTTIGNGGFTGSLSATSCGSPTRYIQEPMFGFQWRPVNDPKWGKLQYSATYSYLKRGLWSGVGSTTTPAAPQTNDSMLHFQMRYYIP
jgi:hypothetical protein